MNFEKTATHVSLADAMQQGPPPPNNLAIPIFGHGTLAAELYMPKDIDPQTPHTRDEIYVVARGSGEFFDGEKNVPVQEGSFLFVPAGVDHRFENFTDDLVVWVFFYGPEGGETND
jgi:mannose-6-phosphate isomerase-like protein (cupin superfamily)